MKQIVQLIVSDPVLFSLWAAVVLSGKGKYRLARMEMLPPDAGSSVSE